MALGHFGSKEYVNGMKNSQLGKIQDNSHIMISNRISELEYELSLKPLRIEVPIEKIVEVIKHIEIPVEKIVEVIKYVDRIVEIPTEKTIEVIKHIKVPVEKIVHVSVDRIVEIEKIVEKISKVVPTWVWGIIGTQSVLIILLLLK